MADTCKATAEFDVPPELEVPDVLRRVGARLADELSTWGTGSFRQWVRIDHARGDAVRGSLDEAINDWNDQKWDVETFTYHCEESDEIGPLVPGGRSGLVYFRRQTLRSYPPQLSVALRGPVQREVLGLKAIIEEEFAAQNEEAARRRPGASADPPRISPPAASHGPLAEVRPAESHPADVRPAASPEGTAGGTPGPESAWRIVTHNPLVSAIVAGLVLLLVTAVVTSVF